MMRAPILVQIDSFDNPTVAHECPHCSGRIKTELLYPPGEFPVPPLEIWRQCPNCKGTLHLLVTGYKRDRRGNEPAINQHHSAKKAQQLEKALRLTMEAG